MYNITCFVLYFLLYNVLEVSFSLICTSEYLNKMKMVAPMRNCYQCLYRHFPKWACTARQQHCYNNENVKNLLNKIIFLVTKEVVYFTPAIMENWYDNDIFLLLYLAFSCMWLHKYLMVGRHLIRTFFFFFFALVCNVCSRDLQCTAK